MKTLRFVTIFLLPFFTCCTDNPKDPTNKIEAPNFIFDIKELRLLNEDTCDKEIILDSFKYISQFDSAIENYILYSQIKESVCICFNYLGEVNFESNKFCVGFKARSYGNVSTTIPKTSTLIVSVASSNSISSIVGNEVYYGGSLPVDSLNNYVKRLFLNKPDTSRYGEKFVSILFPDDNLQFADTYLTQVVIGYIRAQREICKANYGKDLRDASVGEINELKKIRPLRFKIYSNKNLR